MANYFLPSQTSCCVCNSSDQLEKCNVNANCGNGYSHKLFAQNIDCLYLRSLQNCATWHELEIVSVNLIVAYTETKTGDCCCLYLPGTGGCPDGCPEPGYGSIVTDFQSSSVTFGIDGTNISIEASGLEIRTETTDCQDGTPGQTTTSKSVSIQFDVPKLCCSTSPGLCSNSKFGVYMIPAYLTALAIGENHDSNVGECLSAKGFVCDSYPDLCTSQCPSSSAGNTYGPDISASLTLIIKNWKNETIITKEIYPESIICPVSSDTSCCECQCLSGAYSYLFTLSGSVIVRIGNE